MGTVIVLAVEGFGSKVVEMTILPQLLEMPYILYVFALLVASAIAIWWPEIWSWISPTQRIIRRGEAKSRREKDARVEKVITSMKQNPLLGNIEVLDYERALVEAVARPRARGDTVYARPLCGLLIGRGGLSGGSPSAFSFGSIENCKTNYLAAW